MSLIDNMSKDLGIDVKYIDSFNKPNRSYKIVKVKIKGKERKLYMPSKELKTFQYWMVKNIFSKLPVSRYALAYKKNTSIKQNAQIHSDSKYYLHMDIKDFFPNITKDKLHQLLEKNKKLLNISDQDIFFIEHICLFADKMVGIGSVCAPIIANTLMYEFDLRLNARLSEFDKEHLYTRYADDIIISSRQLISEDVKALVKEEVEKENFLINEKKTYFFNKSKKRIVTGVYLDNNGCGTRLTIGTKRYRKIKKDLYRFLVYNEGNKDQIIGFLSFVKDINKGQYMQLVKIYSRYDKAHILFNIEQQEGD